ncbi:MAG: family 43 glycosylhydrolase [Clostridia bacterium]|nr:family 43 glycosylhydrolase [Clostridia bacterium]
MKRKLILLICIAMFMLGTIPTFAKTEDSAVYYYVNSQSGDDNASGTSASAPVKTFTRACNLAKKTSAEVAYIVITNRYPISTYVEEVSHKMPFIVTTNDGKTDFAKTNGAKIVFGKAKRYYLGGETTFENITFEFSETLNFVAGFNPITFGEGVTTVCLDEKPVNYAGAYIVGGKQSAKSSDNASLDSHITVKSGTFKNIVGGSRMYADAKTGGLHYKGTHYINILGGEIETLYGGTFENHWSNNINITVSGGHIETLYTAGDETRRANGNLTLNLVGGKVDTVNVNNILGNATVNALGTHIGEMKVLYHTLSVSNEERPSAVKKLNYSSLAYTKEEIEGFGGFDTVTNSTCVYVSSKGGGNGEMESSPTTFKNAMAIAAKNGATVIIIDNITLTDFKEARHEETITVKTQSNAKVTVKGTYTLGGKTVFDGIAFNESGIFNASVGKAVINKNCTFAQSFKIIGSADIGAGIFDSVTDAKEVLVRGGEVKTVECGAKNPIVEVLGGRVESVRSAKTSCDTFTFTINGGNVKTLTVCGVKDGFSLNIYGGEVENYLAEGENARGTAVVYDGASKNLGELGNITDISDEYVCFVSDDGTGSGRSANDPTSSLAKAYQLLGKNGGKIVVCGKLTIAYSTSLPAHSKKVTITSLFGGIDYTKTNNAAIVFKNSITLGGETVFENISLGAATDNATIFADGNKLIIGDGVSTYSRNLIAKSFDKYYISLVGGAQTSDTGKATSVTVNSGKWQKIYGGDVSGSTKKLDVSLTINGGEVVLPIVLGSGGNFCGNINAEINGGTFYGGIYATEHTGDKDVFSATVNLTFNGGKPYATVGITNSKAGIYNGSFDVNISGGKWGHLVTLCGSEGLVGSITSSLSGSIDFDAEIEGTVTFTNPIRQNGADPWLFYYDGYYYYTATDGHRLGLARAANIGDLAYAEFVTVYKPRSGEMWSKNLWSPEIHYYTDEEIGEGNGGWYCYIACDNGDNLYHRMYVIKCLDGDNLFGRWGNPVTGEVNVPEPISAKDIEGFADTWAAGQTDIRINGKLYMMYVTETGRYRKGDGFYQTENLVEMTNPWTIVGQSSVICRPEYNWEKGGSENGTSPQVVEGGTAVYADDGSIYIIYSGSGYWTTEYQLGQLKYLGGDPLDINNWEKKPTSILYKSDEINGCGHASYLRDHNGVDWICYHAYIGKDTSSGRYAFVEPYTADKSGVVIADGNGHPAPIEKEYTSKVNPMPLSKRISGFDKVENRITIGSVLKLVQGMVSGKNDVTIDQIKDMLTSLVREKILKK